MKKKQIIGSALAAGAALVFATLPVSSAVAADKGDVQCFGSNACKGNSECKTSTNSCKGQNSCKGTGVETKASADECTKAGGTVSDSSDSSAS